MSREQTSKEQWAEVEAYVVDRLLPSDAVLDAARADSDAAGLPRIEVSPPHAKLLHLLARSVGARAILEIGTLGGYSTIWLARALPEDGRLVTLEYAEAHAEVARGNLARAGLDKVAQVRVGAALDSLPKLVEEGAGPFDLVFVDADKVNSPRYVEWALKLTRPGSLIVVDNVVRGGAVTDGSGADASVRGTRETYDLVAEHPRLDATAIQTVGGKGWDGMLIARVTG
ncbi:methyltransferase [Streptomyces solincola]|uniref:Methyltransferase n=1 Tax=Streptomyces solincola TaxID=2100817 RepID=A0A2S9PQC7_9ACTN|nr:O-methyltransferase [Streptomyces solincola]PRH76602.1 methyltransferase [Streptomyces solincola]